MEPAVGLGACRRGAADAFTRANARIARPDSTATLTATSDPKPTVGRARNMIGHARRILLRGQPGGRLVSRRAALTAAIGSMWLLTSQPAEAASVDLTARRDDGSLIYWSLDRQHGGPQQGILVFAQVETSPWWDGRLVLFGGSEGGAAVSMLAPRVRPTAVVVFSTAPGRSFRESFKLAVPPEVAAQADSEFAKIKADPLSPKLWGGNSYRWWADILDHDLTADLLSVRVPILIVHGERDRSGPVQVARKVRDDFRRAGRCNLTYWEFRGYDHQMQDAAGISHIDEVMQRISRWLVAKVSTGPSEDCPPSERSDHE